MKMLAEGGITAPKGFVAGATRCGLKPSGNLDLAVVYSDRPCVATGVFTSNKAKAAHVLLDQERLRSGRAQAVVVNAGNANACTGEQGRVAALEMARLVGEKFEIKPELVLVASTGVIGVPLPMEKVRTGIAQLQVSREGAADAAHAIMTTDTRPKECAVEFELDGHVVTIGAMAKGAGMIHPNLATLLVFITTDAALELPLARAALRQAIDLSFNSISVDGDTSTNDTAVLLANGSAGNVPVIGDKADARIFQEALNYVAISLAKQVARDGEGATKLIEVNVEGAANLEDARIAARAVTRSNLVKAAFYGNDPNWGRILCAVGNSGANVDPGRVDIAIEGIPLMVAGEPLPFDKKQASAAMNQPDVNVKVRLNIGSGKATAWGCDLTEDYVKINAEYTT